MSTNDRSNLAGSVRQTLGELARVSDELDGGEPIRPSLASRLDTLAAELRQAAAMIREVPRKAARS
jgi:hypothetical protein